MKQIQNPILPLYETIADGEPHVFGNRIYLFGSHDKAGGDTYCMQDYVFWSAPVDDPSDWSNKGVNYSAKQDPLFSDKLQYMYAPDVVQGNDGRFYLYYCLSGYKGNGGYGQPISVAVCDTPDGRIDAFIDERYASWKTGIGAKVRKHETTLLELSAIAEKMSAPKLPGSGRQEYLENIVNSILFR